MSNAPEAVCDELFTAIVFAYLDKNLRIVSEMVLSGRMGANV